MTNQSSVLHRGFVEQASAMISVQAGCSTSHAVVLMVIRAQETGTTLEQIAAAVVDGEIRFGLAVT